MIQFLISQKLDIEKVSIYGKPIDWAVGNCHVEATLKLLELGADPNGDLTCPSPAPIILAIDFGCKIIYDKLV